ncbi:General transcription factor IIF subunit 1 [Papilio machaon]|uniref:Transcription initiation factor IIF subunit alpha n=1 Tax=Papilio machaon TaxID=76193 RepID=A0A194RK81_PAPMA|nr:General transcription factor IIF subunit 1 [Papilio machaon]
MNNPPGGASSQDAAVQEFTIRVPKNIKKKHHVMRFNATLKVDFAKWTHVKMERENNIKEFKGIEEEMPKYGAGSEYGRDLREEARRKKFGITSRKYKPEDQPWILKIGGKKFKGIREGGVSENAAYYVFTHGVGNTIEAFPLLEWYNFQPIQRYKALSAEEAEQEFGRRNKVINYFSLMFRKRMRGEEGADDADDPDEKKPKGAKAKKESSSDFSSDSDTDPETSGPKKTKKTKSDKNPPAANSSAPGSASTSRAGTPQPGVSAGGAAAAVAAANAASAHHPSKRVKLDAAYTECGVTEEAVRRYLARKPMTTTELLTKFKSKRTGVSSDRLVETMTQILKRINPLKQNINGKMYLSINHT